MSAVAMPGRASDAGPEESTPLDTQDLLFEAGDCIRTANRLDRRSRRMEEIEAAIDYLQRALVREREGRPYIEVAR